MLVIMVLFIFGVPIPDFVRQSEPSSASQPIACSPLTPESKHLWETVTQQFRVDAGLIPRLTDNVIAVKEASRHGSQDHLRVVADELVSSVARTLNLIIPYLQCVQDICLPDEDDFSLNSLSTLTESFTAEAFRLRAPADHLYHNLAIQKSTTTILQRLLARTTPPEPKNREPHHKLTNLLVQLNAATDRCGGYIRRINGPISKGLAAISSDQERKNGDGENDLLPLISALETAKMDTKESIRRWDAMGQEKNEFLFGSGEGDMKQWEDNAVAPVKEGVLDDGTF